MILFHWKSEALKQYRDGDIIVHAPSVPAARQRARTRVIEWLRTNREYYYMDPEDTEDHDSFMAMLDADLAKEPRIADVIVLLGGE